MKIFVAFGFESFPFDRLVRAIERGVEEKVIEGEVVIQNGDSRAPRIPCRHCRFMKFDEVLARMREADIVVGHAGVGTAFLCLDMGKVPVLFPRLARFGEHVDDHQVRFARKLAAQGKALTAESEKDLLYLIGHYSEIVDGNPGSRPEAGGPALRDYLEAVLGKPGKEGGPPG